MSSSCLMLPNAACYVNSFICINDQRQQCPKFAFDQCLRSQAGFRRRCVFYFFSQRRTAEYSSPVQLHDCSIYIPLYVILPFIGFYVSFLLIIHSFLYVTYSLYFMYYLFTILYILFMHCFLDIVFSLFLIYSFFYYLFSVFYTLFIQCFYILFIVVFR